VAKVAREIKRDFEDIDRDTSCGARIACVIPAFNEEKNIRAVLEVVSGYDRFDEIIIVDDGSVDGTCDIVLEYSGRFRIKLLKHEVNKGKTAAVLTGIDASSSDVIVMLDADLINLTHENLDKLIDPIVNRELDLAILDREGDRRTIFGFSNCARFFGGERAFWKKDFVQIDIPEDGGFLLEIIMNLHYIENGFRIKSIHCPNLYTVHQFKKFGKVKGYTNYLKTSLKIVRESGLMNFMSQARAIESDHNDKKVFEETLKKLYGLKELQEKFSSEEMFEFISVKVRNSRDRVRKAQLLAKEKLANGKNVAKSKVFSFVGNVVVKEIACENISFVIAINDNIPEFEGELGEKYSAEYFLDRISGKASVILIGSIGFVDAGYIVAYDKYSDGSIYCWMAGVDIKFRRRSVLKNMMNYLFTWAEANGYSKVTIKTRNNRREMLRFLVKYGFNICGFKAKEDILENRILLEMSI